MYIEFSALAVSGNTLYAGGDFTTTGGAAANYVARWNGSSWSTLSSGMNGDVNALTMSEDTLYAGGYFTTTGGTSANYIAPWNGSGWSVLGSGMNNTVLALAASGNFLYAGGQFTTVRGKISAYAAEGILNPGCWLSIQEGVAGSGTDTMTFTMNCLGLPKFRPDGSNRVPTCH
jgi:trimeric autotransporter adhesin